MKGHSGSCKCSFFLFHEPKVQWTYDVTVCLLYTCSSFILATIEDLFSGCHLA